MLSLLQGGQVSKSKKGKSLLSEKQLKELNLGDDFIRRGH